MVHSKRRKQSSKKSPSKKEPSVSQLSLTDRQTSVVESKRDGSLQLLNEVEDYAIIVLDLKGTITSWNKGAEKIKGYTAEEVMGKNYRIFYTSEDRKIKLSEKLLNDARAQGKQTYEGWRVKKNGSRFWGSITLTALHDSDGNVNGYLKVTRDLTEKKVAEDNYSNFVEELKMKNEELQKSEERYHKMVSEVQDYAIILLDRDGKVLDWNKGAEKLKRYSPKEIVGKNFRLFYTSEDRANKLPEKLLSEAMKNGSVIHEGWRIKKGGKRFWANVNITSLHNDAGETIGFSKVTRDLTERKEAEDRMANLVEELEQANERLKESEQRYHKMIAEVQDYAIILLDSRGHILNWNAGAELIKGYAASEIVGRSFRIFYSKQDQSSRLPDRLLAEASANGKVYHEGWRVRKDGSRFWGSVAITALHNNEGSIVGFSKVTRDLTERKSAEDALKATAGQLDLKNKALERANEELGSFTNVASHDLKEPLRKIQTFAHRIKDVKFDPLRSEEFVDKIVESAARMQSLIEDLLSFSQASNDSAREDVDLNQVIASIKNDLEVAISEKNAAIKVSKMPILKAVRHQMNQLFLNLISNAIKFSRAHINPVIRIECRVIRGPEIPGHTSDGENQYYHIVVKDNGVGFDETESTRIFNPFYRAHSSSKYSGTGLGLAIVKKIVENHQGIVTAESQPNVGTNFHIYLPKGNSKLDR